MMDAGRALAGHQEGIPLLIGVAGFGRVTLINW